MRPATVIGWTGKGTLGDLERSVRRSLAAGGVRGFRAVAAGTTLVGRGSDPLVVTRTIANLPGVSWIALGYEFSNGLDGLEKILATLAGRYLRRGMSFNVSAEAMGAHPEGDVVLAANSRVISSVKGTHVDEKAPDVRFRVSIAGEVGACGVQTRGGVGGVPTSNKKVACILVSGGRHSSVAAWMCALAGFSLRLVHIKVDDESLRQVASLYSELSYRMDPSSVGLEIVQGGGGTSQVLGSWVRGSSKLPILVGAHLECGGDEALEYSLAAPPRMWFPLLLLQEEGIRDVFRTLGLKERSERPSGILTGGGRVVSYSVKKVKRARADMHVVMDSLVS